MGNFDHIQEIYSDKTINEMIHLKTETTKERFLEYSLHCLEGGFKIDAENQNQFEQIISDFEQAKGIIIQGNTGSGKSLIFRMLQKITHPKNKLFFVFLKCDDVVREFNIHGHEVFNNYKNKNIIFDDLGTEDKGIHYGDKVEVMEKFIAQRYDLFCYQKIITHFTTNLSKQEIESRYDLRCISRLKEMCSFIILGSGSDYSDRRKLLNFKLLKQVFHPNIKSKEDLEWEKNYAEWKEREKNKPKVPHKIGIGAQLKQVLGTDKLPEVK